VFLSLLDRDAWLSEWGAKLRGGVEVNRLLIGDFERRGCAGRLDRVPVMGEKNARDITPGVMQESVLSGVRFTRPPEDLRSSSRLEKHHSIPDARRFPLKRE
jgi:hypothetical protein